MATLKQIKGTGKQSGKNFTGYVLEIGEFKSKMFFLSPIEKKYLVEKCEEEGIYYDGD